MPASLEEIALSFARERLEYRQAIRGMQANKCESGEEPCWIDQDQYGTKLESDEWCERCKQRQVYYEARTAAAKRMAAAWRKFIAAERKARAGK